MAILQKLLDSMLLFVHEEEKARLSVTMPFRCLSVMEDETWLGRMNLVGMDSASNFIIVEQPAEQRDGESWNFAMSKGLDSFNAKIVQVTSDEGKGLIHHAEEILGAHHSPDLFHIQREISRGRAATLAAQVRSADKKVLDEQVILNTLRTEHKNSQQKEPALGRPIDWNKHIEVATDNINKAIFSQKVATKKQKNFREALRGMSEDYHPIDFEHGTLRSAREFERRLFERFNVLHYIMEEGQLPEYSTRALEKAERVLPRMVSTLSFVLSEWERFLANLELSPIATWQIRARILPALYLEKNAGKKKRQNSWNSHFLPLPNSRDTRRNGGKNLYRNSGNKSFYSNAQAPLLRGGMVVYRNFRRLAEGLVRELCKCSL